MEKYLDKDPVDFDVSKESQEQDNSSDKDYILEEKKKESMSLTLLER